MCHQPARAVSIFENCFGVETHGRKCFGIPVSVLGWGYAPLYGAALCGGVADGVQTGQRVWWRAYAPTPIFEYVARYLNVK